MCLLGWLLALGMVIYTKPNLFTEFVVILGVWAGVFSLVTFITNKKKLGLIVSVGIVGLLLLRRWYILDWLSFGLWIAFIGFLTLFN